MLRISCCLLLWLGLVSASYLSDAELQLRLLQRISAFDADNIPVNKRSLSIYYLSSAHSEEDSMDVLENNLKIFAGAVRAHSNKADHRAFYIFSVANGDENVLSKHLPFNATNAAFIKSSSPHNDIMSHIQMVSLLGDTIISKFHSVLFLNQDARGPFVDRANGVWWKHFTTLLDDNPSVALLGPVISCEIAPHVQIHAFAMRSEAVLEIFSEFNPRSAAGKKNKAKHLETTLSIETQQLGHKIASIYYHRHFNKTIFDGQCISKEGNTALYKSNPTSWCGVQPRDTVFMKWGGHPLRIRGYYCQDTIDAIRTETIAIHDSEHLDLNLPETMHGGKYHMLYKEYDQELWLDRSIKKVLKRPKSKPLPEASKVCLVVRTSIMQGKAAHQNTRQVPTDVSMLVKSLLRQRNPNWEAYFIVTDDQPFEGELQALLREHEDLRLHYLPIDLKFRPKYQVREAGYTATDQALRVVQNYAHCKWLSITNGDNIYGSAVFDTILNVGPLPDTKRIPDVVLSPLDSRNYADQDYTRKRIAMDRKDSWELRCGFLEAELQRTRYGYAMTPFPTLGGLDLAGLFMDRQKFISTGVYFTDFSDSSKYVCPGCQDGYFISEVMTTHKWSLHRQGIQNFNSLIFHGPSSLWCVASGNVWFDHPGKTVCLSHKTVGHLFPDGRYDWESFYQLHGMRMCLRMSEKGFANMTTAIIT